MTTALVTGWPRDKQEPNAAIKKEIICCPDTFDFVFADGYDIYNMRISDLPIFPSAIDGTTYPVYNGALPYLCSATKVQGLSGKSDLTIQTLSRAWDSDTQRPTQTAKATTTWDYEQDTLYAEAVTMTEYLYPIVTVINTTTVTVTETCHGNINLCPTRRPGDPGIPTDLNPVPTWLSQSPTTRLVITQHTPSAACTAPANLWVREKRRGCSYLSDHDYDHDRRFMDESWFRCEHTVFGLADAYTAYSDRGEVETCQPQGGTELPGTTIHPPGTASHEVLELLYTGCPKDYKLVAYETSSVENTKTETTLRCCPTAPYQFEYTTERQTTRTTVVGQAVLTYVQESLPYCVATSVKVGTSNEPTVTLKVASDEYYFSYHFGGSFPTTTAAGHQIEEGRLYADDVAVVYTVHNETAACFRRNNDRGLGHSETCLTGTAMPTPNLDGLHFTDRNGAGAGRGAGALEALVRGLLVTLAVGVWGVLL